MTRLVDRGSMCGSPAPPAMHWGQLPAAHGGIGDRVTLFCIRPRHFTTFTYLQY